MRCKRCRGSLDLTLGACPACGAEVELGRLTGILGIVCRACDAYNEPGATTCAGCGKALRFAEAAEAAPPAPAPAPAASHAPAPAAPAATPAAPAHTPATPATPFATPVPPSATPAPSPPPGAPVVRSFARPAEGATRFVPSVLRPSAEERPGRPEPPAHTPVPLASTCPRCGAAAGSARFCARCGAPLGGRDTQVAARPTTGRGGPSSGPLAPGRARLVLEPGGDGPEASWPLDAETVAAGRSTGEVLFPDDPYLSPHHATFFFRGGALHVRDEGGPSGLYLRLRGLSVPLRPGDHFVVGARLLRYAGPLPPAPPPPADGTRRLGSPRPPAPTVVVEECLEGGTSGRVFVRGGPSVTIGRAGCGVSLGEDPLVSQAHAEILVDASGAARLKDLGSSSGTYVKIPPHGERELRDGDRVRMGRAVLRISAA